MNTYMSIPEGVHVGQSRHGNLVILDARLDRFFSLDATASFLYLQSLGIAPAQPTTPRCLPTGDGSGAEFPVAGDWERKMQELLSNNLLEGSSTPSEPIIRTAIEPGGLSNTLWKSTSSYRLSSTRPGYIFKALALRFKADRMMRSMPMTDIFDALRARQPETGARTPSPRELSMLTEAVDIACLLYPKRTRCFAWAMTTYMLLTGQAIPCTFTIGCQTAPFLSHAWVECAGHVLNDRAELKTRLVRIISIPEEA